MKTKVQKKNSRVCILFLQIFIGLVLLMGPALSHAQDQEFPSKPVEVIVPYGPGGVIDIGVRIFAEPLSRELKVPVVAVNKKGGGGLVGSTAFYNTKHDGYTVLASSAGAIIPTVILSKNPSFDPRKDFLPVGRIGLTPCAMFVHKDSPFKTFQDFVEFGKKNPGKLRGGYASAGGETHIMFVSILKDTKIQSKMIPYTASGERNAALLGGHIDWSVSSLVSVMPFFKSRDMRPLLLTQKSPDLPDVPAGADVGLPSVSVNIWLGFFVHADIQKAAYNKLVTAVGAAISDPKTQEMLVNAGFIVDYKDPEEYAKIIKSDWEAFDEVLEVAGMKKK